MIWFPFHLFALFWFILIYIYSVFDFLSIISCYTHTNIHTPTHTISKYPIFQEPTLEDEPPSPPLQDDHATDEEKLASSTNHKWAALHDMESELTSDTQDFPQPSDLTSFVNSLPPQTHGNWRATLCLNNN